MRICVRSSPEISPISSRQAAKKKRGGITHFLQKLCKMGAASIIFYKRIYIFFYFFPYYFHAK